MNNVLALQQLAIDIDAFGGILQSQVTQGPECSTASIQCVPPNGFEAEYQVI
jgi:hypothetical protein